MTINLETKSDSPETVGVDRYRLQIDAIGRANSAVLGVLEKIDPRSINVLAELMYQAPSILLEDIDFDVAQKIHELLKDTGLQTSVEKMDAPIEAGVGDQEIALVVAKPKYVPAVSKEVAEFLGVDIKSALKLVCSSPAILMGNVSVATVESVRKRFSPLGAELDVSKPNNARFDVLITKQPDSYQQQLSEIIRTCTGKKIREIEQWPIVLADLDISTAHILWKDLRNRSGVAKIVNRDFQRFDIQLESASNNDGLKNLLAESAGIPALVVDKVLSSTPMVVKENVGTVETEKILAGIVEHGGIARALPLPFQTFGLKILSIKDQAATQKILSILGSVDAAKIEKIITRKQSDTEERFSRLGAQWMQYELKKVGTQVEVTSQ